MLHWQLQMSDAQRTARQRPATWHSCVPVHNCRLVPRRPSKIFGAAHFTLRCGRQLPGGQYQRPLVALACNFGGHILSLAQAGQIL